MEEFGRSERTALIVIFVLVVIMSFWLIWNGVISSVLGVGTISPIQAFWLCIFIILIKKL